MNHIRKQANITRYTQIASHGLSPLRSTFALLSIVSKKHIFSTSQSTGGGGMKKLFVFLCVAVLIASSAYPLFAGGIDNKTNWSAEWVRSLNRNAATDSADAASYNPAGVMKMDNGFYLNATGQYALKEYSNTEPNTAPFSGTKYTTDEPDFVPSLFALYKQDKWSAYGAVTVVVAGGKVDYENGDNTTAKIGWGIIRPSGGAFTSILDQRLEGKSYFIGYTIGGAYKINDMISVSLGARFVDASREFKGHATLGGGFAGTQTYSVDYEETGNGWGGILGVNIAPTEELNIGLRYETKTSIDLETSVTTNTLPGALNGLITDGFKRNRDLPALLGLGVSYKFTPKIRVEADLTYYFNEDADWEDAPITTSADETKKDNGYDIGIACEYTFTPKWKASVGYMYTNVGIEPDNMSVETPELDAATFAGGVSFKPTPDWDVNLGILKSFYGDAVTSTGIFYEKDVVIIALGVQYKFF
jgi:long-chain fatty acid transport protein